MPFGSVLTLLCPQTLVKGVRSVRLPSSLWLLLESAARPAAHPPALGQLSAAWPPPTCPRLEAPLRIQGVTEASPPPWAFWDLAQELVPETASGTFQKTRLGGRILGRTWSLGGDSLGTPEQLHVPSFLSTLAFSSRGTRTLRRLNGHIHPAGPSHIRSGWRRK